MSMEWIIEKMNKWAPEATAESFDNVGLLVGDPQATATKVLVALDATDAVIKEAIDGGFDCIITHHPLTYNPLKRVVATDPIGRKVLALARHGISLYAAHTNLDKAPAGVNDRLAEILELPNTTPLQPDGPGSEIGLGIGAVGHFATEMTLGQVADHVKKALGLTSLRYGGDVDKKIKKVAICGGSGMGFAQYVKDAKADLYITGDIKYSDALPFLEDGIAIIDITHYSGENIIIAAIVKKLTALAAADGQNITFAETSINGQTFFTR